MPELREVVNRADLRRFIAFPYELYAGDTYWVPPLRGEVKRILTTHPFHRHAESRYFLALEGDRVVGRIAAIVDHRYNEFTGEALGFFGFFECRHDEAVARALFEAALETLRTRGLSAVRGPASPSSNGEFGLLIDGFDRYPAVIMPYHKPYYQELIEGLGFLKAKDLLSYEVHQDRLNHERLGLIERILARRRGDLEVTVRALDRARFNEEVETVLRLYNEAWERNWGFVPMTEEELRFEAKQLRPILDSRVVLFADVDGEPVGFGLSLPDVNLALRHANGRLFPFGLFRILYHSRRIKKLRTLLLGVTRAWRERGLEALLYLETIKRGIAAGYCVSECSWILEDNHKMRTALEKMGGEVIQTYRVYEREL